MPTRAPRARPRLITALASVVLLLPVAISAAMAQDDTVVITSTLEPASLQVAPGTTVTWRNDDAERHRVRSREGPERFDSGNLDPGERFTFAFTLEGTYPYVDHRDDANPAYFGTIVVTSTPGSAASTAGLATSGAVTIGNRVFIPPTVEIATGGTVEWTNTDGESHTATSADGTFDSGVLAPGDTFSQAFDTSGTFAFSCAIHPEMHGTITVSDPAPGASPPIAVASSPAATPNASSVASPSPSAPASAAPVTASTTIAVADRAFDPTTVEIPVGGSVEWSNQDAEGHTATAADGTFDSGVIAPGETFTQTFDSIGSYDFFCAIHPQMHGTIAVVAAPGPSPPTG